MVRCCVENCRSNSKCSSPDLTYHKLPDHRCFPNLYNKWLRKISGIPDNAPIDFVVQTATRVCSLHFTEQDFVMKTDRNRTRRTLRIEAFPTQRLPPFSNALKDDAAFPSYGFGNVKIELPMCSSSDPSKTLTCMVPEDDLTQGGRKAAKRIKVEPGRAKSNQEEVKSVVSSPPHAISPQHTPYQTPGLDATEEQSTRLPACYRGKKNINNRYLHFIRELDPELGYPMLQVNNYKYVKYDPVEGEYQMWRCSLRNCCVKVVTASVHWSVFVGIQGCHFHLPTTDVPLNPYEWCSTTSLNHETSETEPKSWTVEDVDGAGSDANSWSPEVGRDSGCEESPNADENCSSWNRQQYNRDNSPPYIPPDARFNIQEPLAPRVNGFQIVNLQQPLLPSYPTFSVLDSLSKFCVGQTLQGNPYNTTKASDESDQRTNEEVITGPTYGRMETEEMSDAICGIADARSLSTDDQTEYILPSPASDRHKAVTDEASEGSSSGGTSARMEEPSFYELVEEVGVNAIVQKDPLSLDENSRQRHETDQLQANSGVTLKEEDAAFFQTLASQLELLSPEMKDVFKKEIIDLISRVCN